MTAPGTPFESPRACPFVALEHDRDRRSDTPDYSHRCFAEPTPAPRSIAHQEAYCLSPNFAACPVFQDWAVRAAARPVDGSGSSAANAASAAAGAMAAGSYGNAEPDVDHDLADVESETPQSADPAGNSDSALEELPEDASVTVAGAEVAAAAAATTGISPEVASPPTFATTDWQSQAHEGEQLGAFDAAPGAAAAEPAPFDASWYAPRDDARSSYGQPDAGYPEAAEEPPAAPPPPAFVPPPARPEAPPSNAPAASAAEEGAAVAAPAFLAGRSSRPQANAGAPSPTSSRDDIVPSWDVDGRYGAAPPPQQSGGGGGSRLDGILTAIAVIAILALGVAAVLFLPGLLNRGSGSKTPAPSIAISSSLPTALPSGLFSFPPSVAPTVGTSIAPTLQPSQGPVGSPKLYKIKAGDSLQKVANRFGVTIQDILNANPDISNPDNIFVGQIIVIPLPAGT